MRCRDSFNSCAQAEIFAETHRPTTTIRTTGRVLQKGTPMKLSALHRSHINAWSVVPSVLLSCFSLALPTAVKAANLPAVPAVMACSDVLNVDFTNSDVAPMRLDSANL